MNKKALNRKQLTVYQILQTLEQNKSMLKTLGVRKIGLFGSYTHGSSRMESDIDFLVQLDQPTFDNYMNLKIFLEDLFLCKIDLVLEETLKPRLRPYILEEVIYASGL